MLLDGAGHPGPITPEVEVMCPEKVGREAVEGGDMEGLSLSVATSHLAFSINFKIDLKNKTVKVKTCLICPNV